MFLTLLRLQHPLVYRFAWLRLWVAVLRACGLRKRKGRAFYAAVAAGCGSRLIRPINERETQAYK